VDLGTHLSDDRRRGADPGQTSVDDGGCEVGVFGEKPEAGMHGVAAGALRGLDDGGGVEVARHQFDIAVQQGAGGTGIAFDVHAYRCMAKAHTGLFDAASDLASVRNQDFHAGSTHIL